MSGSVNAYWYLTLPHSSGQAEPALGGLPRRARGAAVLRLEEDAQDELGFHLALAAVDLVQAQLVHAGEPRQPLELQQELVEPVEVAAEAHLDRLLAVGGAALALHGLDGLGRELVLLGHVPDLLEDLVDVALLG